MIRRNWFAPCAMILAAAVLAGCAAGPNPLARTPGAHGVAGFWLGLWHGLIIVVTLIVSLFDHHVHIYEVRNNGAGYDIGFVLGALIALGGGARSTHRS